MLGEALLGASLLFGNGPVDGPFYPLERLTTDMSVTATEGARRCEAWALVLNEPETWRTGDRPSQEQIRGQTGFRQGPRGASSSSDRCRGFRGEAHGKIACGRSFAAASLCASGADWRARGAPGGRPEADMARESNYCSHYSRMSEASSQSLSSVVRLCLEGAVSGVEVGCRGALRGRDRGVGAQYFRQRHNANVSGSSSGAKASHLAAE